MSNLSNEGALPPINVSVAKKKRNLPGRPDPDAEVIALSPRSLLTTNRFVCEICNKGFQRDQNLQLHRRGHNLPWRLKQKENHEYRKKVYICPELNCVHHDPARALGDLTGIKKHFSRKHGEKKWKCDKCSKRYAVQSDWKAHQKTCGTKEYRCDCGTLFSRKDSFITHRAFCDVLENGKDPPCNDDQSQKPAASPDDTGIDNAMEDTSAAMDTAASPVSQVSGDVLASSDFVKPNAAEKVSDPAIPEGGIASLSSKWMPGGIGAKSNGPSQGPGLSLCLGTGLGPGPPSGLQVTGTQNAPVPPFRYPSPKDSNKLAFSQVAGSESQISSKHVPSIGAMGMLASLFSSSAHRQSGVDSSDSIAHAFSIGDHDHCTLSAGLSSSAHDPRNAYGPSKTYLHSASAATSATALLQKAAELGAKASNPSVLQRYGIGGIDHSVSRSVQGMPRESPWASFGNNLSGSMSIPFKAKRAEDVSKRAELFATSSKSDSMHAVMGSSECVRLPGSTLPSISFQAGPSGSSSTVLKHERTTGEGNLGSMQSFGDQVEYAQQNGSGFQRGHGERRMVDFLGVGSSSGTILGKNNAGMGQILSHRDLASITSLTAGIKVQKRFHYPDSRVG
ncbi:hypothetical protein GOP47_0015804 [Adiantum capillus-veneris]|uniref:C2H2-type domain-containing protein n=1 Tax=Adiantum capillus-veneris TaxID=13818 RepID=A0A9D4ZBJ5_ADICA|nr:hypothetical protein GOP47_0015804 [Adiantum capillus-veneris]